VTFLRQILLNATGLGEKVNANTWIIHKFGTSHGLKTGQLRTMWEERRKILFLENILGDEPVP
jgi:hypothetical protein